MAFGVVDPSSPAAKLLEQAFSKWEFTSWNKTGVSISAIPELTRFATDLSMGSGPTASKPFFKSGFSAKPGPSVPLKTIMLEARARGVTIQKDPKNPARLVVSGMEERRYKDHKIFEVT
jgi:hypothetical protein